jgi:hypothetical protein
MAIDTAAKRKSCLNLALLFLRPGVVPAATNLSAPDRLHTQGLYSGIAAGVPGGFVVAWAASRINTLICPGAGR